MVKELAEKDGTFNLGITLGRFYNYERKEFHDQEVEILICEKTFLGFSMD